MVQKINNLDEWEAHKAKLKATKNRNITSLNTPKNAEIDTKDKRQVIGFIGAFLLILGVFTPIIHIPLIGSQNFFQNGHGDGVILLILGGLAIFFALGKIYTGVFWCGLGSLIMTGISFFYLLHKIESVKLEMSSKLVGNPFRGIADLAAQSLQFQWGWVILIAGSLLLLATKITKEPILQKDSL